MPVKMCAVRVYGRVFQTKTLVRVKACQGKVAVYQGAKVLSPDIFGEEPLFVGLIQLDPFRTAVPFWGRTTWNYL